MGFTGSDRRICDGDRIILMAVVGVSVVGILLLSILLHTLFAETIKDCQNTRDEVLIEELIIPTTVVKCKVIRGEWFDPYTGQTFTDPKLMDVDHFVPLKEAHLSGGYAWSSEQKRDYANYMLDSRHLIAVSAKANRAKGSKDPARWLPQNQTYHCEYVQTWTDIKDTWELTSDDAERTEIEKVIERSC